MDVRPSTASEASADLGRSTIPRWANHLGDDGWDRLNEMLREGCETSHIMAEMELPKGKLRSLQLYARKWGPRRRLERFSEFKDALMAGAATSAQDFAKLLKLIVANATSPNVKESTQRKACALMTEFAKVAIKMADTDQEHERERMDKEAGLAVMDNDEVVDRMRKIYGLED